MGATTGRHRLRPHHRRRGISHRRWSVLVELVLAAGICVGGYHFGAQWLQVHEAAWVVAALHLVGVRSVSGALPGHILIFRPDGDVLNAVVTSSCSAILSLVGLVALTVAILRRRRLHAIGGLLAAIAAVLVANDLRLAASTLAGLWWGRSSLVLFHDWVGTLWTLASTLGGFLVMVWLTLPGAERAEQDVAGRHTARRPDSWARPGLGYRLAELDGRPAGRRRTLAGLMHRYVLPRSFSRRLAERREHGRIDYRIGHLSPGHRAAKVRALAADGLGAHAASLLAVATYEQDPEVLDNLAEAIAARQWEPVTSHRVTSLRLWARGWMLSRAAPEADGPRELVPAAAPSDLSAPADLTAPLTARRRPPRPRPPAGVARRVPAPGGSPHAVPRSFARSAPVDAVPVPRPEDHR